MSTAATTAGPPLRVLHTTSDPWLTLIWQRLTRSAQQGLRTVTTALAWVGNRARNLTVSTTTLLATPAGYDAALTLLGTTVRTVTHAVSTVARMIARPLRWLGRTLLGLLGRISPTAADTVTTVLETITRPVRTAITWAAGTLTNTAQLVEGLAHTAPVRTATTRTAQATTGLLLAEALTSGGLSAQLSTLLPHAAGIITMLVQPWAALALIGTAFTLSAGITLARILRSTPGQPDETGPRVDEAGDAQVDLSSVRVLIAADGTPSLHGLPDTLPQDLTATVANAGIIAAQTELARSMGTRTTPNSNDRKKATRAARRAVHQALSHPQATLNDAA